MFWYLIPRCIRHLWKGGVTLSQSTEAVRVSDRLAPVLAAAAERIHYAEGRRANFTVMAGALIAAGIAVLTLSSGALAHLWMQRAASYGAIASIVAGGWVILLYSRQTNRYPFTSATKAWKWFYRDALPKTKDFKLHWYSYLPWAPGSEQIKKAYGAQLGDFRLRMSGLQNDSVNLEQDVEQLYVLHVTELYKNIHLKHLSKAFNCGLLLIALAALVGAGHGVMRETRAQDLRVYAVTAVAPVSAEASVARLSPLVALEPVFFVRLRIRNAGPGPLTIQEVTPVDRHGYPLPAEVSFMEGQPAVVSGGKETTVAAHLRMRREFADKLVQFRLRLK
jgi:hypothetical protein